MCSISTDPQTYILASRTLALLARPVLKNIITHARENSELGLRICDLDSILHSRLSKSILTVIELIAYSHSEKATGVPASPIVEHFKHISTVLDVHSSD